MTRRNHAEAGEILPRERAQELEAPRVCVAIVAVEGSSSRFLTNGIVTATLCDWD
jgi:hypothetical protein